ncbi:MAG: galactokinase [Paludisphaera borealis]|uniref:galactokinase n=1 Tax=Paludisphaera borealis TaxID=1387353 RepID=UPI0028438D00|nr:galactokinase [Paludisphaera borealis]MDR3620016.1 galactokinase [Paludisphaera borealis]
MTPAELEAVAVKVFAERYGSQPSVASCAPGRVELLGNHTDYNGGLVMAAAIDRYTTAVGLAQPTRDGQVYAVDFDGSHQFPLADITRGEVGTWPNYVKGVVWAIQEALDSELTSGFEVAIAGDVPLGAGLSSSASLQAAIAFFLLQAGVAPGRTVDQYVGDHSDPARMDLAMVLRRSENAFVGVSSGLLDQFSSLFGKADHALFLDCQSLEFDRLPLGDPGPAIIVCDSKTSRRLADGMYNRRFAECQTIVSYFRDRDGGDAVSLLRDVSLADLERCWDDLDPIARKRARHVLTENERVRQGVSALKAGDLVGFGRLISASHASSRDDFENSSPALDALVEAAESAPGFLGGKLSGAGWAGCTVNLVEADKAEAFAEAVAAGYSKRLGVTPDVHICRAAEGASSRSLVR